MCDTVPMAATPLFVALFVICIHVDVDVCTLHLLLHECLSATDRAKMLGDLGTIIGASLVAIGLIIYYVEKKKRESFSKIIYID